MLIVAFVTTADVLLRWLSNSPIDGLNEIVGMGLAVAVAATFPAGAAQRVNLTIDLLAEPRQRANPGLAEGRRSLLLLVFYVFLAWRIGVYAMKLQARAAETVYVQLPMAPFIWAVAAFLAVSALAQVIAFCVTVRFALAGIADPSGWSIGTEEDKPAPPDAVAAVDGRLVLGVALALMLGAALVLLGLQQALGPLSTFAKAQPLPFTIVILILLWALLILDVPLAAVMGLLGSLTAALFIGLAPAISAFATEGDHVPDQRPGRDACRCS